MDLVLDLGQSGARVRYAEADYSFNLSKNSNEPVIGTLQQIFEEMPKQEFESVFLSLTGLQGVVPDTTPYGNLCREFFKAKAVAVKERYAFAIIHFGSNPVYLELEMYFFKMLRQNTSNDIIYLYSKSFNKLPLLPFNVSNKC